MGQTLRSDFEHSKCTVTVRGTGGRGGRCGEFLLALGDLVVTGPTRTNVNDYRAILIV